jgi:hypothetical protein
VKVTTDPRQLDMFGHELIIGLAPVPEVPSKKKRKRVKRDRPVQLEMFEDEQRDET